MTRSRTRAPLALVHLFAAALSMQGLRPSDAAAQPAAGAPLAITPWYLGAAGYDRALRERATGKSAVLVYFGVDWCGYCRAIDRDLFPKLQVQHCLRAGAETSGDSYDAACCLALGGDRDGAFSMLLRAIDAGFRDVARLQRDNDLVGLRADERWSGLVVLAQAHKDGYLRTINAELARLHEEDQRDRAGGDPSRIDWKIVGPRDARRRARVQQILDEGGARVADDYYHAAMVFQHGDALADYEQAQRLALRAAALGTGGRARWLAAAAADRLLMKQGRPQRYGTQFRKAGERWELYTVDPKVSDEERAAWHVPSLAAARRQAEEMNARR